MKHTRKKTAFVTGMFPSIAAILLCACFGTSPARASGNEDTISAYPWLKNRPYA